MVACKRGLGLLSRTAILMLSTPPPIAASTPSCMIWCAAIAMACNPDEQKRFTVVPAVVGGRPASMAATRATLWPCGPCGCPQPRITSSISLGSSFGVLRRTSWMQCAARSSGRVRLNDPRNDFASAVRELVTTTASLMVSSKPSCFQYKSAKAGSSDGLHGEHYAPGDLSRAHLIHNSIDLAQRTLAHLAMQFSRSRHSQDLHQIPPSADCGGLHADFPGGHHDGRKTDLRWQSHDEKTPSRPNAGKSCVIGRFGAGGHKRGVHAAGTAQLLDHIRRACVQSARRSQ